MLKINRFLTFAYDTEYESAYDLSQKRNFSNPKIYTAKGDLKKRWYVYFSFRNPKTGKLKRLTPFYGNANKYKTKEDRMEVLCIYRITLLKLLKQGYNPFLDNTELYNKLYSKKVADEFVSETRVNQEQKVEIIDSAILKEPKISLREAFDFSLKLKNKVVNERTIKGYENRVKIFLEWLEKYSPKIKTIDTLNRKNVSAFLNYILDKTSPRNRNNYRTDLSSLVQVLEDNDIIESNFMKKIPVLKSIPERNKNYTQEEQEEIFSYLKEKDPILLLYIKFIAYGLLRPLEVCRLRVKDLNLNNKTIQFKAKNSLFKTKIIPEILLNDLPDLGDLDQDSILFTPEKIGGVWNTLLNNRRDYFSKRFKKVVKDYFKLGKDYGLYSFRHTYITILYKALVKESSPFEAKSKLMQITGHSSMSALEKYLRDIDAELPSDYSEMLKRTNE